MISDQNNIIGYSGEQEAVEIIQIDTINHPPAPQQIISVPQNQIKEQCQLCNELLDKQDLQSHMINVHVKQQYININRLQQRDKEFPINRNTQISYRAELEKQIQHTTIEYQQWYNDLIPSVFQELKNEEQAGERQIQEQLGSNSYKWLIMILNTLSKIQNKWINEIQNDGQIAQLQSIVNDKQQLILNSFQFMNANLNQAAQNKFLEEIQKKFLVQYLEIHDELKLSQNKILQKVEYEMPIEIQQTLFNILNSNISEQIQHESSNNIQIGPSNCQQPESQKEEIKVEENPAQVNQLQATHVIEETILSNQQPKKSIKKDIKQHQQQIKQEAKQLKSIHKQPILLDMPIKQDIKQHKEPIKQVFRVTKIFEIEKVERQPKNEEKHTNIQPVKRQQQEKHPKRQSVSQPKNEKQIAIKPEIQPPKDQQSKKKSVDKAQKGKEEKEKELLIQKLDRATRYNNRINRSAMLLRKQKQSNKKQMTKPQKGKQKITKSVTQPTKVIKKQIKNSLRITRASKPLSQIQKVKTVKAKEKLKIKEKQEKSKQIKKQVKVLQPSNKVSQPITEPQKIFGIKKQNNDGNDQKTALNLTNQVLQNQLTLNENKSQSDLIKQKPKHIIRIDLKSQKQSSAEASKKESGSVASKKELDPVVSKKESASKASKKESSSEAPQKQSISETPQNKSDSRDSLSDTSSIQVPEYKSSTNQQCSESIMSMEVNQAIGSVINNTMKDIKINDNFIKVDDIPILPKVIHQNESDENYKLNEDQSNQEKQEQIQQQNNEKEQQQEQNIDEKQQEQNIDEKQQEQETNDKQQEQETNNKQQEQKTEQKQEQITQSKSKDKQIKKPENIKQITKIKEEEEKKLQTFIDVSIYKTIPCIHFHSDFGCEKGNKCQLLHINRYVQEDIPKEYLNQCIKENMHKNMLDAIRKVEPEIAHYFRRNNVETSVIEDYIDTHNAPIIKTRDQKKSEQEQRKAELMKERTSQKDKNGENYKLTYSGLNLSQMDKNTGNSKVIGNEKKLYTICTTLHKASYLNSQLSSLKLRVYPFRCCDVSKSIRKQESLQKVIMESQDQSLQVENYKRQKIDIDQSENNNNSLKYNNFEKVKDINNKKILIFNDHENNNKKIQNDKGEDNKNNKKVKIDENKDKTNKIIQIDEAEDNDNKNDIEESVLKNYKIIDIDEIEVKSYKKQKDKQNNIINQQQIQQQNQILQNKKQYNNKLGSTSVTKSKDSKNFVIDISTQITEDKKPQVHQIDESYLQINEKPKKQCKSQNENVNMQSENSDQDQQQDSSIDDSDLSSGKMSSFHQTLIQSEQPIFPNSQIIQNEQQILRKTKTIEKQKEQLNIFQEEDQENITITQIQKDGLFYFIDANTLICIQIWELSNGTRKFNINEVLMSLELKDSRIFGMAVAEAQMITNKERKLTNNFKKLGRSSTKCEQGILLFGFNDQRRVQWYDPEDDDFMGEILEFPKNEHKIDYSLIQTEDKRHTIAIGGRISSNSNVYSLNYILTPYIEIQTQTNKYKSNEINKDDLLIHYTEIPPLNISRKNCSLCIFNDYLYVFYGSGIKNNSKVSQSISEIEFAKLDELLSYIDDTKKIDKVKQGKISNPFKLLEIESLHMIYYFNKPMIFPNLEQPGQFFIFGGQTTNDQSYNRIFKLNFDFGKDKKPKKAVLSPTQMILNGNITFSQTILPNKLYNPNSQEWIFIDQNGGLHIIEKYQSYDYIKPLTNHKNYNSK